jgi:hypothetical protein
MADKDLGAMTDRELRKMIEVSARRGMPPISVEGLRRALEEALEKGIREGVIRVAGTDARGRTVYESLIHKSESTDG